MTTREKFVELAASGLNAGEIAESLGISRQRVFQLKASTGVVVVRAPPGPKRRRPIMSPYRFGIKISPSLVGAVGELHVATELMKLGFVVYQSLARTGPFDLFAYRDGVGHRIEVRSIRKRTERPSVLWEHVDILALVMPDGELQWQPRAPWLSASGRDTMS